MSLTSKEIENSILHFDILGDLTKKELNLISNNFKKLFYEISFKKPYNTCYGKVFPLDLKNLQYEKDLMEKLTKFWKK